MPDTNAPWGQQQQQQQQYSEQQYSEQQYSEQAVEITQTVRPRPRPRPRPHLQVGRHAEEATSSSVANGSAWSNGPPQVKGAPVGGAAVPPLARPKLRPPFTEPSLPTFRPKLPTLSVLSPPSIDGTTPMRPPPTFAGNGHMFAPEDAAFRHYSAPGLAPGPLPGPVPGQRFIMPLPAQQFYPMYASTYRTAAVPLLPPFHQPSEPGQEVTLSPIKHRKLHILDPQGTEIALEPAKPPVAPQTNTLNVTAQLKDVSHRATPSAPTAAQFFRVLKSHPDNYDIEAIWKLFFEGKIPSICDTIYMPDSVLVTQSEVQATAVQLQSLCEYELKSIAVAIFPPNSGFEIQEWKPAILPPLKHVTIDLKLRNHNHKSAWLLVCIGESDVIASKLSPKVVSKKPFNQHAAEFIPGHVQFRAHKLPPPPVPKPDVCLRRRVSDSVERAFMFKSEEKDMTELYFPVIDDVNFPPLVPPTEREQVVQVVTDQLLPKNRAPLDVQNYFTQLGNLLKIEEAQMIRDMRSFTMLDAVPVSKSVQKHGAVVRFKIPGIQEMRPPVEYDDRVLITAGGSVIHAVVVDLKRSEQWIDVKYDERAVESEVFQQPVRLEFLLNRWPLLEMRRTLDFVQQHARVPLPWLTSLDDKQLPPKQLQSKPNVETFFDNTLNWEQQRAVQNVVSSDNLKTVHIIFGPPGTGKTTTVVEIARQLMQNPELRILLTAPSNQACDILTTRLASVISGEKRDAYRLNVHKTLFRLNAYTRTLSEVPDTVRPHTKAKYSITDNSFEYYDIPSMEDLKTYRVIVVTCITSGILRDVGLGSDHFTHILLDESAQAMEPESLVPFSFASSKTKLVMAGDHCQLGPMIRSPLAIAHGLGVSLQERLLSWDTQRKIVSTIMLKNNYRANEKLLYLPSKLFYRSQLEPQAKRADVEKAIGWPMLRAADKPFLFVQVDGMEILDLDKSLVNPLEVVLVVKYVKAFADWLLHKTGGTKEILKEIAVISPFRTQVKQIRSKLREIGLSNVNVGTVEDNQGQEHQFVFISTFRSSAISDGHEWKKDIRQNMGIINNPKRFNVATTRSKSLLVVFGNPAVLEHDIRWAQYIKMCANYGNYIGDACPENLKSFTTDEMSEFEKRTLISERMQSLKTDHFLGAASSSSSYGIRPGNAADGVVLVSAPLPNQNVDDIASCIGEEEGSDVTLSVVSNVFDKEEEQDQDYNDMDAMFDPIIVDYLTMDPGAYENVGEFRVSM